MSYTPYDGTRTHKLWQPSPMAAGTLETAFPGGIGRGPNTQVFGLDVGGDLVEPLGLIAEGECFYDAHDLYGGCSA